MKICGYCVNWKCDNQLHLKGHCTVNRMDRFHGEKADTCTRYESMWYYKRPLTESEKENKE